MPMHVTPRQQDVRYDPVRERGVVPLTLHRDDGTSTDVELILEPGQVELQWAQLDRLLHRREQYLSGELR
ncbi:hypothetical protein JJV70_03760 [Streptomyces sp. JJ66]|uniref:hypothetical protein n=1 Tax=Streptomyces sp. JJ66 TaxID=2803843 RepID=UPI001C57F8AF|nr:hypothetical protein [Streptomyces sp. JJ66]MBW1601234.1 hypothetical protein [Streptomyces sp. JJ66]